MRNYYIFPSKGGAWVLLATIPCLLIFTNSILAQNNTSYNGNSIPVNNGINNAVFGLGAFSSNTTGNNNTAIGYQVLNHNTAGILNSAIGYQALNSNTAGNYNTADGSQALASNTTGGANAAIGFNALAYNTTGSYNTAIGYQTLYFNSTGGGNTATGYQTLIQNLNGIGNTAIGYRALYSNIYGYSNTAFGDSAGFNSLGSSNVFIGNKAGANETGSNKIYIGNDAVKTLLYGDFSSGQILFGKPNATGYVFKGTRTLNVLGGILADSVRVALSGDWADKVFKKNYPLKPLHELEHYISSNKHLPGIPSASEVEVNGVNVGDMETKLLEKVEELTLYVLELKKENQQQQEDINKLKRRTK